MHSKHRFTALTALLLAAGITACDQSNPTAPAPRPATPAAAVTLPTENILNNIWLCKDAPDGTFDFTVDVQTGTNLDPTPSLAAGACELVATPALVGPNIVTVTEPTTPGYLFDHIAVYHVDITGTVVTQQADVTEPTITRRFGDQGWIFVYVNVLEPSEGCTLTQGFWKNHPSDWPVTSLTLGTVTYTEAQLIAILKQPVKGNGLVSLAHQLIAAKLNIAAGASGTTIAQAIADADAAIGSLVVPPSGSGSLSTSSVGSLVSALDAFNRGLNGPTHCGSDQPVD